MRDDWEELALQNVVEVGKGGVWGADESGPGLTMALCLRGTDLAELIDGKTPQAPIRWVTSQELLKAKCEPNMILIETSGSKCGRSVLLTAAMLDGLGTDVIYSNFCRTLRIDTTCLMGKFAELWFSHKYETGLIPSYRATSAMPNLDVKSLLRLEKLRLPPIPEQRRIVDVVSSVDTYIESLQSHVDAARTARNAVLHDLLSAGGADWKETTLDELILSGIVSLGRGNVISKKDMESDPGPYPVYSSAQNHDGRIGTYNKFMFDEELITWSVDGGGHVFYRPRHKFSVTNIGGYLRILNHSVFDYQFLTAALQQQHSQHVFDWQNKAHPSVIRKLYTSIPLPPLTEQQRIVDVVSSMDVVVRTTETAISKAKRLRAGLLSDLLSGENEIPESYDRFLGAA